MDSSLESVIPIMIEKYPQALRSKNESFQYPLNIACKNKLSDWIIFMILHGNPDAIYQKDKEGNIPSDFIKKNTLQNIRLACTEQ
jgi:hypothetical protein